MGKQEFEFPSTNETMQIGGWIRTSKRWKRHGERDTVAWKPPSRKFSKNTTKMLPKWLTLFITVNCKTGKENNHGVV